MLKYKNNLTLSQGGPDIGLKVGILAEIGNMLHECALSVYNMDMLEILCQDLSIKIVYSRANSISMNENDFIFGTHFHIL